ncbi:MAG: hypothetical protein ABI318_07985 [Chthoniobacteraceae bacterium]
MNPNPAPSAPQPPRPHLVVSGVNRRDVIIGVLLALVLGGFIAAAIFQSAKPPGNLLTGVIRAKDAPGLRETLMTVSRHGVSEKTADTGYSLKVWVESQKRDYDVMVMKDLWEKKKVGDTLEFLRPPSEQH